MPSFFPGLCSVTFRNLPAEEIIALAARAGLSAIEWGADVHVPSGSPQAAGIAAATRDAGLTVSSYGSYLRAGLASPDELAETLETTRTLGAPIVRVWAGAFPRPSSDYDERDRAHVVRWLEDAGAKARAVDLAVGVEYHPGTLTDTLASARTLMDHVSDPGVFLYWQPRPGISRRTGVAEIAEIGAHVAHVHVFAWDANKTRYPLSLQADNWLNWIGAMPQGRWTSPRYAMLEFVSGDDPEAFLVDAATLNERILDLAEGGC